MHEERPNTMPTTELIAAESDEPSGPDEDSLQNDNISDLKPPPSMGSKDSVWVMFRNLIKGKPDTTLRETLEDAIEEGDIVTHGDGITAHEKMLLSNVLKLKDENVTDVMVPRADIVAVDIDMSHQDLLSLLSQKQFSRLPVYKGDLDNVLGSIHIKDILADLAQGNKINIKASLREIPVVSPAMPILGLMLYMQQTHKHMAFVVDEFGGIDGLVTIGDVIESVVGEIDDEYDQNNSPQMDTDDSGDILADARVDIDDFEARFGQILSADEREESETLGGLLLYMAGRVPARGEILTHNSGMVFEVIDADPRKINRIRIKNIPSHA